MPVGKLVSLDVDATLAKLAADASPRTHYSVGQIAKILEVAPRTVHRMCDEGMLKSFRLAPGLQGGHRRILHSELVRFATEQEGYEWVLKKIQG